jgi:hypothetical protein
MLEYGSMDTWHDFLQDELFKFNYHTYTLIPPLAAMRPRNIDYQQFIHLVEIYREWGWDPIKQSSSADVQTTGIFWQVRLPI